jgi:nitrite reductase (NADH) large subunit
MTTPRLLVIGNGMTGDRLLDELERRGGFDRYDVTVVGDELHGAYSRILLSEVLAGAEPETIVSKPASWYAERGVTLIPGRLVDRLDRERRVALLEGGGEVPYDMAVLALGATAIVLPIPGLDPASGELPGGVHVFRTLADCLALRAEVEPLRGRRAVAVVGGGLLGLELAKTLADQGHRVSLVHPFETLMNTQLDRIGGDILRTQVEAAGIDVVVGMTSGLRGDPVEALELEDGRELAVDTVVLAVGARPRTDVARRSGIEADRGVLIDDWLRTSDPHVYAIGDCAQHEGAGFGLVAPGWDQALVLADLLTGDRAARYRGSTTYARLKAAGVEVASLGLLEPEREDDDVVQVIQERRGVYRKLVIRNGRLAGAIAVGDPDAGALLVGMLDRGLPLPDNPVDVFCSPAAHAGAGPAALEVEVCNCNHVTEPAIRAAIAEGCSSVADLKRVTKAGTGCGSCTAALARLIHDHAPPRAEAGGAGWPRPPDLVGAATGG